jgi:hypothetical protein
VTAWFRGSGQEYRIVDVLEGRTDPLIVPLDFPDAPDVDDPEAALNTTLAELRHWYLAPTSPGALARAGVPFAITSDGLASLNQFLPNLRIAVARGLSPTDALAALTVTPAGWLGIERTHGTIAQGKVANLVVADGDLFTQEADVVDVWIDGRAYDVTSAPVVDARGTWRIASSDDFGFEAELRIEGRSTGSRDTSWSRRTGRAAESRFRSPRHRWWPRRVGSRCASRRPELEYEGSILLAGSVAGDEFYGWSSLPNGADPAFSGSRTQQYTGDVRGTVAMDVPELDLPFIRPMMEYGRSSIPEQPAAVLVRNATVWTQGPDGPHGERRSS